jgi:hypothetical protein
MWEEVIAGAGGVVGLYVALRHEVRRTYELLQKDVSHVQKDLGQLDGRLADGLTEVRADIRRLDEKIDDSGGNSSASWARADPFYTRRP